MRLLGLDVGSARIGVALGDEETRLASPHSIVDVRDQDDAVKQVVELAEKEGITRVVVGIPRKPHDLERETPQAVSICGFADLLRSKGLEVVEEDETLTSKLAATLGRESGRTGAEDDLAATAILQTYLDKHGVSP